MMQNPIKTYEPNTEGRDFVIGDLHGSLRCFQNLLKNLNFDPAKDRMFSVGDLVDRGPNSLECLELLNEPWFHSVLANHEQMMLEAFDGGYMGQFWVRNGGHWGQTAWEDWVEKKRYYSNELDRRSPSPNSERLWKMLDVVRELPFLMTVKLRNGQQVHIIHAELPPGVKITDSDLSSPAKLRDLATWQTRDGDVFCWGRWLFAQFYEKPFNNRDKVVRTVAYAHKGGGMFNDQLSHVISGHTIMQRPFTLLGQTNIDTKAYGAERDDRSNWNALTCLELNTWSFYQATPDEFRTVEPFTVNIDDVRALSKTPPPPTPLIDALNKDPLL